MKTATTRQQVSSLSTRSLTEGAILVALAQILSYLPLWRMPWGGSVDLAMAPILLFACRWGVQKGLMAGFVYGIFQFIFDGGFVLGWPSIIGDYLVAYTVLGLAGLFSKKPHGIYLGTTFGCLARFLVHYVVGATIWMEYMPEEFFGITMTSPWFYSLLYNGFYMGIDLILCLVIFALMTPKLSRYLKPQQISSDEFA